LSRCPDPFCPLHTAIIPPQRIDLQARETAQKSRASAFAQGSRQGPGKWQLAVPADEDADAEWRRLSDEAAVGSRGIGDTGRGAGAILA